MSNQRKQILQMLAEGKISADDAERLLDAVSGGDSGNPADSKPESKEPRWGKFLRVVVQGQSGQGDGEENVDIKIPLVLLKAGIKLGSVMPRQTVETLNSQFSEKGFNFNLNELDSKKLEEVLSALEECPIEIEKDDKKVKIFCC
ncbi:MAG: hypothetical protein HRF51_11380 [bacterium]|jgi:hypothetical protein